MKLQNMTSSLNRLLFIGIVPFLLGACTQKNNLQFDTFIENANIIDGTGKAAYVGSVGINADTIAFIGATENYIVQAKNVINGATYTLAPGFIDPHTHALEDLSKEDKKQNLNYLYQGVTTVFTGSDGDGPIKVAELIQSWNSKGIGTNAAIMVGHETVRRKVMNMSDAEPDSIQLNTMKALVKTAMEEGAFGLSTGLYYTPGNFAKTEEVIELARIAAEKGGVYDSHIRDESSYTIGLIASIEELIRIAREANIHANISHIKALGVDVWDKSTEVIQIVESAQKEGLSISADQYPYRASGTRLSNAIIPRWAFANGFYTNFNNPSLKPKIIEEMKENLRRRGGAESLLFTSKEKEKIYKKTLADVAKEWEMAPIDAALKIIEESDNVEKDGASRVASFNMKMEDIHNFMQKDWVTTSSDGSTGHPRKFGSFPKKIKEFVVEKKILSLEEMIRKSSYQTAQNFNVQKRGKIEVGYYADLILFKAEEVKDNATFTEPELLSEGMHYVLVNGEIAIEKGEYTGVLGGKALRRDE